MGHCSVRGAYKRKGLETDVSSPSCSLDAPPKGAKEHQEGEGDKLKHGVLLADQSRETV
jgi:hypothetical protein